MTSEVFLSSFICYTGLLSRIISTTINRNGKILFTIFEE